MDISRHGWICAVIAAALGLGLPALARPAWCSPGAPPSAVRVMTFNILHDGVRTLASSWRTRRKLVVGAIRSARPDVACLQEVSPRQLDDISHDLTEYEVFPGTLSGGTVLTGWARPAAFLGRFLLGDFFDHGEHCPILIRRGLGAPVDSGSFQLTTRPTPHVVNWVRLRLPAETRVDIFNTHLGLVRGRTSGAPEGLLRLLDDRWEGTQILAGDFNALPSGSLLRFLTGVDDGRERAFQDAWTGARGGTFHWGVGLPGPRLDYVLIRPGCEIESVRIAATRVGRILPSDHYAVVADLRIDDPTGR